MNRKQQEAQQEARKELFFDEFANRWDSFTAIITPPSLQPVRDKIDSFLLERFPPTKEDKRLARRFKSKPAGRQKMPFDDEEWTDTGANFPGLSFAYEMCDKKCGIQRAQQYVLETLDGDRELADQFYALHRIYKPTRILSDTIVQEYKSMHAPVTIVYDTSTLQQSRDAVTKAWTDDGYGKHVLNEKLREMSNAIHTMASQEFGLTNPRAH